MNLNHAKGIVEISLWMLIAIANKNKFSTQVY